jgi:hypothetical protein
MNAIRKLLRGSESEPAAEDMTLPIFAEHFPKEMREAMYEAWEKAISQIEAGGSRYAQPPGLSQPGITWREFYRHTTPTGVWQRDPVRPAPKLEGDAFAKALRIAEYKVDMAALASENAQSNLETLKRTHVAPPGLIDEPRGLESLKSEMIGLST